MLLIKKIGNLLLTNKKARLESIRREQLRLQRQFQYDQVHFFYKNLESYFLKYFFSGKKMKNLLWSSI